MPSGKGPGFHSFTSRYIWEVTAFLVWTWLVSTFVLTAYHLQIFNRKIPVKRKTVPGFPGVSILIAHKDQSHLLIANLPSVLQQDYPEFEVIIVDDHSAAPAFEALESFARGDERIRLVRSAGKGKKAALNTGVQAARYDVVLCTDADCRPMTPLWIKSMEASRKGNAYVLGYSPYAFRKGWLNQIIRFETIMTAIQYFSWATLGRPYMGVGRNLLYRKEAFLQVNPFENNGGVIYGDDDTIVQSFKEQPVVVNVDPNAFVVSDPPGSWKAWIKQKHRHLSAARHYRLKDWLKPGLYGISLVIHWLLLPVIFVLFPLANGLPVFLIGIIIRWTIYSRWKKRLREKNAMWPYPLLELLYAFYLGTTGILTAIKSKRHWS